MKTLFCFALVLGALLLGVACLDITPYPILETDAGEPADAAEGGDP